MTDPTPEEVDRVVNHVNATQLEMKTRAERCRDRIEAILIEENCVLDFEGEFRTGQIIGRPLYIPRPVPTSRMDTEPGNPSPHADQNKCLPQSRNSQTKHSGFQSLISRLRSK